MLQSQQMLMAQQMIAGGWMIIQNSSELAGASTKFNPSEAKLSLIIDTIPVIAWCDLADEDCTEEEPTGIVRPVGLPYLQLQWFAARETRTAFSPKVLYIFRMECQRFFQR
jgi:hypothetical protein